jgi:hypothetical protein
MSGVLADHSDDIVMVDVPPPHQGVRGIDASRTMRPPFRMAGARRLVRDRLDVAAGNEVRYAHALAALRTESHSFHPPRVTAKASWLGEIAPQAPALRQFAQQAILVDDARPGQRKRADAHQHQPDERPERRAATSVAGLLRRPPDCRQPDGRLRRAAAAVPSKPPQAAVLKAPPLWSRSPLGAGARYL